MIRSLRRFMAADEPWSGDLLLGNHRRRFEHVTILIHLFYILQLFQVRRALREWAGRLEDDHAVLLWPASWLGGMAFPQLVSLVTALFAVAVISAMIWPHRRFARVFAFLGMLFYGALENSFGKIDHGLHAWLFVGFVFIALPDGRVRSLAGRHRVLTLFVTAQASFLTCYSLAGFWKLLAGLEQAFRGEVGWLSPSAFAYLAANRLGQTASETILGPWVIDSIWIGGPLVFGGLYVELLSLVVIFRPSVHKIWGLLIIGIHLGSILVLDISFIGNIFLAGIFLVAAPGETRQVSIFRRFAQLPLVATLVRLKDRLNPRPQPPAP